MIVIDSSALVKAYTEKSPSGRVVRLRLTGESLVAPCLIDAEVLSVIRGLNLSGKLPDKQARIAIRLLRATPMDRVPLPPYLDRAWELRHNYSAYDALYVALAEALSCPLVTSDARISRAIGARCDVEVFQ